MAYRFARYREEVTWLRESSDSKGGCGLGSGPTICQRGVAEQSLNNRAQTIANRTASFQLLKITKKNKKKGPGLEECHAGNLHAASA